MNSTYAIVRLGTIYPHDTPPLDASLFDNSIVLNILRNSFTQIESSNFPLLSYGSSNSSHQQFPRYQMTRLSPLGIPAIRTLMMAQYNQRYFWPRPPSLINFSRLCVCLGDLEETNITYHE
ncbi:hypothetical protein CR513_43413, partial [Mucuna pruriens]